MERQVMVQYDDGMRQICRMAMDLALHVGDQCITEYKGSHDYGRVAELHEHPAVEDSEGRVPVVVRRATLQDQARAAENAVHGRMAAATCRRVIEEKQSDMHLLHARYNFDRALLIVTFSAEERVDFRDLIKALADALSVRIEMRQIGVRDAAREIGGMGPCGRVLCCHQWLRKFDAVNVKMAKTQSFSLSASSISGMCGRLKCCLRYEFDTYRGLGREIPDHGVIVETPEGRGVVVDRNLIKTTVMVRLDDQRLQRFAASDVRSLEGCRRGKTGKRTRYENTDPERAEFESAGDAGA